MTREKKEKRKVKDKEKGLDWHSPLFPLFPPLTPSPLTPFPLPSLLPLLPPSLSLPPLFPHSLTGNLIFPISSGLLVTTSYSEEYSGDDGAPIILFSLSLSLSLSLPFTSPLK